jgi:AcrR family transcriptional regulator
LVQLRKAPKQARAKQRVAKLLEVAEQLLIDEGYDSFSTNRVAKEADISIASLYQYFPNKEALVYAINRKMLDEVLEGCERYLELSETLGWKDLFKRMDDDFLASEEHIKLVRELDHAIFTSEELQQMERQHTDAIADFYVHLLQNYGSTWPRHALMNTGRFLYHTANSIYYDQPHAHGRDRSETIKIYQMAIYPLVERAISQPWA